MTEEWRDISGFDGYQVSNFGQVRSFKYKTPRIMKLGLAKGYPRVDLSRDNKKTHMSIHRLVATAFIPNPESKPQVNHIDGNPKNNCVEKLEWCTSSENNQHALATGLRRQGGEHPDAKLTNEQARFIRDNPGSLNERQLAKMFGVDPSTIADIRRGEHYKTAGGQIRGRIDTRIPDDICEQIRSEFVPHSHEFGQCGLAKKYGVSSSTIWRIVNEK